VPTVAEALGLKDFDGADAQWTGLLAPAGTPKEIVEKMQADLAEVTRDKDVRDKLEAAGFTPVITKPEVFAKKLETEIPKWAVLLKDVPKQ
jgi:tripartite-type tricarboxylate transporter receptor subunit TctC